MASTIGAANVRSDFRAPVQRESEWEARTGIVPLAEIQHRRAELLPRFQTLRARYGPGGTWDAQRRAFRAAIAVEIRSGRESAGLKSTEQLIEDLACADVRYRGYLDNAEREMAEWAVLEAELSMLDEAVQRGQAEMRLAAAEWMHTGSAT